MPSDLSVILRGEGMHLRYPEGVRSTVDANLALRGSVQAPTLAGVVTVRSATWNRRIDPTGGLFELRGSRNVAVANASTPPPQVPLRFDIEVVVPATLRVENNLARLVASAIADLYGEIGECGTPQPKEVGWCPRANRTESRLSPRCSRRWRCSRRRRFTPLSTRH